MGCAWGREFRWRKEGVSWGIIKMRKSEREPEERKKKKVSERKIKKKKKMRKVCNEIKRKKKVKDKRNIILIYRKR